MTLHRCSRVPSCTIHIRDNWKTIDHRIVLWTIEAEWHIYVSKLTIIDSDIGLSSSRRQAIIWTNAGIWLTLLGTNMSEILNEIDSFIIQENAFASVC